MTCAVRRRCVLGRVEGGRKHRLVIANTVTYWSGTESIIHRGEQAMAMGKEYPH